MSEKKVLILSAGFFNFIVGKTETFADMEYLLLDFLCVMGPNLGSLLLFKEN